MNISNQTHNLKCILRLLTYDKYYNVSLQGAAYTPLFAQFLAYKALVQFIAQLHYNKNWEKIHKKELRLGGPTKTNKITRPLLK